MRVEEAGRTVSGDDLPQKGEAMKAMAGLLVLAVAALIPSGAGASAKLTLKPARAYFLRTPTSWRISQHGRCGSTDCQAVFRPVGAKLPLPYAFVEVEEFHTAAVAEASWKAERSFIPGMRSTTLGHWGEATKSWLVFQGTQAIYEAAILDGYFYVQVNYASATRGGSFGLARRWVNQAMARVPLFCRTMKGCSHLGPAIFGTRG